MSHLPVLFVISFLAYNGVLITLREGSAGTRVWSQELGQPSPGTVGSAYSQLSQWAPQNCQVRGSVLARVSTSPPGIPMPLQAGALLGQTQVLVLYILFFNSIRVLGCGVTVDNFFSCCEFVPKLSFKGFFPFLNFWKHLLSTHCMPGWHWRR